MVTRLGACKALLGLFMVIAPMKLFARFAILPLAALAVLPASSLCAGESEATDDPFALAAELEEVREPTREERYGMLPKMIQVQVEWIALEHTTLTEILFDREPAGDSTELRHEVQELVREGEAEVLETAICLARPGQKATTESIREHIYPTEWEPMGLSNEISVEGDLDAEALSQLRRPPTPTAFETRNVGCTLEIEPNIGADDRIIDLRFSPELVIPTGHLVWQSVKDGQDNENEIKLPLFYSLRTSTGLTMLDGQYRLASVLTPPGPEGEADFGGKIMLFVKCDVVAIGEEELEDDEEEREHDDEEDHEDEDEDEEETRRSE